MMICFRISHIGWFVFKLSPYMHLSFAVTYFFE